MGLTLTVKLTHPCSERRLAHVNIWNEPLCDVQVDDVWSDNLLSFFLARPPEYAKLALFGPVVYTI